MIQKQEDRQAVAKKKNTNNSSIRTCSALAAWPAFVLRSNAT